MGPRGESGLHALERRDKQRRRCDGDAEKVFSPLDHPGCPDTGAEETDRVILKVHFPRTNSDRPHARAKPLKEKSILSYSVRGSPFSLEFPPTAICPISQV